MPRLWKTFFSRVTCRLLNRLRSASRIARAPRANVVKPSNWKWLSTMMRSAVSRPTACQMSHSVADQISPLSCSSARRLVVEALVGEPAVETADARRRLRGVELDAVPGHQRRHEMTVPGVDFLCGEEAGGEVIAEAFAHRRRFRRLAEVRADRVLQRVPELVHDRLAVLRIVHIAGAEAQASACPGCTTSCPRGVPCALARSGSSEDRALAAIAKRLEIRDRFVDVVVDHRFVEAALVAVELELPIGAADALVVRLRGDARAVEDVRSDSAR